jgi:hypothetical protein
MARFPLKEPDVVALAQAMVSGLTGNAVLAFSRAVQRLKGG